MDSINTESICRIEAYKLDLLSFDSMAFDIELIDGSRHSFCEEDEEWKSIAGVVATLPLIDSNWWEKVTFPAFEERRLLIYKKQNDKLHEQ